MVEQTSRTIDCSHHSSLTRLQQTTADTTQEDLLNSVKNRDKFSLLFDKRRDVSLVKIRYLVEDKTTLRVESVTSYLAIRLFTP